MTVFIQMHRQNQEVARKEINRCQHELGRLRAQEKALQQRVQELEKVAGSKAPEPDGGGGGEVLADSLPEIALNSNFSY
jgi:type II secretory pathway component PulM